MGLDDPESLGARAGSWVPWGRRQFVPVEFGVRHLRV